MTALRQTRSQSNSRLHQLAKLGNEGLGQSTLAIRRAVENRLFAVQADADNLAEAARAEIKAAAALDTKLEFNRAAVRGADVMLTLAERAWEARVARLRGVEQALSVVAKLKTPKLFWLVPRAPIAETP